MEKFKNFFNKIEKTDITLKGWIFGFLGIIFVRILLENFSSAPLSGFIASDAPTIIHYYLFFFVVAVSLMIFYAVMGFSAAQAERFVLYGLTVIWLPPILDLIHSGGAFMHYPTFNSLGEIFRAAFFFFSSPIRGITYGMKAEIIGIAAGVFVYSFYSLKKLWKAVVSALGSYFMIVFWGSAPSLARIIHDYFAAASPSVGQFFVDSAARSIVAANFLHPTIQLSFYRAVDIFFDLSMSYIFYITGTILLAAYFFISHRRKFLAVMRNSRPLRLIHYYILLAAGFILAANTTHASISLNWLDIFSLATIFITYFCLLMFAIGENEIADFHIDKISNASRPLVRGDLDIHDLKNAGFLFLIWALIGGFLAGHYVLFMALAALGISQIYSMPPLRLKRFPIISSFLMSLAALSVFLSGFFTLSGDKSIRAFPLEYLFLIILVYTLGTNVKDIKDVDGDRAQGVMTLPVLFGEKTGKRIVAFLFSLAFWLLPLVLNLKAAFLPSVIAGIAGYFAVMANPYREKFVFLLYFLYAAALFLIFVVARIPTAPLY